MSQLKKASTFGTLGHNFSKLCRTGPIFTKKGPSVGRMPPQRNSSQRKNSPPNFFQETGWDKISNENLGSRSFLIKSIFKKMSQIIFYRRCCFRLTTLKSTNSRCCRWTTCRRSYPRRLGSIFFQDLTLKGPSLVWFGLRHRPKKMLPSARIDSFAVSCMSVVFFRASSSTSSTSSTSSSSSSSAAYD